MRDLCPCCGGRGFERLLSFDALPQSGLFRKAATEPLPLVSLEFELCPACSLVRQGAARSPRDYGAIDRSAALRLPPHVRTLLDGFAARGIGPSDLVLEVGSNDGAFLAAMRAAGHSRLVGVEPSIGLAQRAAVAGIPVVNGYFDAACAARIVREYGRPSAIICRHTVEHVLDPLAFVGTMRGCLPDGGGVLLLELPDGAAVPELLNVYELWDEHLYYFSAQNAELLLNRAGCAVMQADAVPYLDTRNIVLWACPAAVPAAACPPPSACFRRQVDSWRRLPEAWRAFARELGAQLAGAPKPVYAVGASHPQTNFFGFADLGCMVDVMIDDDPAKVGQLAPMKGAAPPVISTTEFERRAAGGTVVLTGFGYPAWAQRIRTTAVRAGMTVVDPGRIRDALR